MLKFTGPMSIEIKLDNGIYVFDNLSGYGKSYLYKLIKMRQVAGEPVVAYTNDDYACGVKLRDFVERMKPTLIVLDRADLYGDDPEIIKIASEYEDKAIVLVDKKQGDFGDTGREIVGIDFDENGIWVV